MTFGRIIAEARKALGITQKDLAASTRISPQYLNDIERDRRDPPSGAVIERLAASLNLSVEYLIAAAGLWPSDLRAILPDADPKKVEAAFAAFRRALN